MTDAEEANYQKWLTQYQEKPPAMKPSYITHDPKGWCGDPKRGAALGRPSVIDASADFAGKLTLRRVRLDSGGYDPNGTYFGTGTPLYWIASDDGAIDYVLRASYRFTAKLEVLRRFPKARFYR